MKEKNLELSENILGELEKALHLLWKISCLQKPPAVLTTYHAKFIEKYGEHRTVPLLELRDEDQGLSSLFENSISNSSESNPWEKWLHHQWQECFSLHSHPKLFLNCTFKQLAVYSRTFPSL